MKNNKKTKFIIIGLVVLVVALVGVTIFVLKDKSMGITIDPDYAAGEIDDNAENMGIDEDKNEAPEGGGSVSLTYSNALAVKGNEMTLLFENPSRSTKDLVLQVILEQDGQEIVIAQSNRLPAGYKLTKLTLDDSVHLSNGLYEGKFTVYYYDPNSNEKASLDTDIPISITVK